jgi:hypothetical protein
MRWDVDRAHDDHRYAREVSRRLDLLIMSGADAVFLSMCAIGVFASVRPRLGTFPSVP